MARRLAQAKQRGAANTASATRQRLAARVEREFRILNVAFGFFRDAENLTA